MKKRNDAEIPQWTAWDLFILTWMAEQYGMRVDHLQVLLAELQGRAVSLSYAQCLVSRWKTAGWVESGKLLVQEPVWIWPTSLALRELDVSYRYRDLGKSSISERSRWAVLNEIRLQEECDEATVWLSQRDLSGEATGGQVLPGLPDAEMYRADGARIGIKVELGLDEAMPDQLLELLGESYREIWYIAKDAEVRRYIRERCNEMDTLGILTSGEAQRIRVLGCQEEEFPAEQATPQVMMESETGRRPRSRRVRDQEESQ